MTDEEGNRITVNLDMNTLRPKYELPGVKLGNSTVFMLYYLDNMIDTITEL